MKAITRCCLLATGLGLASSVVMDDAAAIKLRLNRGLSTAGSQCLDGDAFRFHDAAITLSGGVNVTMADVRATWDAPKRVFTTSGGEVLKVDGTEEGKPTIVMKKAGGTCVYDMEVKAGGAFMGLRGPGTIIESGVWKYGPLDVSKSEGTHCATLSDRDQAFVAYTTTTTSTAHNSVVFSAMDGTITDPATMRASLTSHFMGGPNSVVYLTVSEDGVVRFSTLVDEARNLPVGCVYPIKVVEGSVLGATPAAGGQTRRLRA